MSVNALRCYYKSIKPPQKSYLNIKEVRRNTFLGCFLQSDTNHNMLQSNPNIPFDPHLGVDLLLRSELRRGRNLAPD